MQNANQIHEFIKLVYQYNLNWLWFIVIKVIQFQSNPENEFFFSNALIFNNKHKFSCTRHSIHGCDFMFMLNLI